MGGCLTVADTVKWSEMPTRRREWSGHANLNNTFDNIVWTDESMIMHFAALAEGRSLKPADRAKLKDYYNKWTDAKYLFGCAPFVNLLKPA